MRPPATVEIKIWGGLCLPANPRLLFCVCPPTGLRQAGVAFLLDPRAETRQPGRQQAHGAPWGSTGVTELPVHLWFTLDFVPGETNVI